MTDPILDKMKKGVYYPGHHLGEREKLAELLVEGHIERMDASFLCGPDSEPAYRLTASGCRLKKAKARKAPPRGTER
jgi:hypothetical protein